MFRYDGNLKGDVFVNAGWAGRAMFRGGEGAGNDGRDDSAYQVPREAVDRGFGRGPWSDYWSRHRRGDRGRVRVVFYGGGVAGGNSRRVGVSVNGIGWLGGSVGRNVAGNWRDVSAP